MSGSRSLRLVSASSLIYAPQWVAEGLGLFEKRGLQLDFGQTRPGYGLAASLFEGEADLLLGNLWFCFSFTDTNRRLVPIAQSNRQCHHLLLGRDTEPAFEWSLLRQRTLLIPSDAHAVGSVGEKCCEEPKYPLTTSTSSRGSCRATPSTYSGRGIGDFILLSAEFAQGTDWPELAALADLLGPVPWSVYCLRPSSLTHFSNEVDIFYSALMDAQLWIEAHSADDVSDVVGDRFSAIRSDVGSRRSTG